MSDRQYRTTNYLKQYEKPRGLLIGPYEDIIPGINVNSQKDLINKLDHLDNRQLRNLRLYWLNLTDQVNADSYCDKIFDFMTKGY